MHYSVTKIFITPFYYTLCVSVVMTMLDLYKTI